MAIGKARRTGTVEETRAAGAARIEAALTGGVERGTFRDMVTRLGGTAEVARMTGRSQRQVQRWAKGEVARPKADALDRLHVAETRARIREAGHRLDSGGRPSTPVRVRVEGHVQVKGTSGSDTYSADRRVPADGTQQLSDQTMATVVDALARGDRAGALQAIEADLSTGYFQASGYSYDADRDAAYGAFLDRIDDVDFNQSSGDPMFADDRLGPDPRGGPA